MKPHLFCTMHYLNPVSFIFVSLVFFTAQETSGNEYKDYSGYAMLRVNPSSNQSEAVRALANKVQSDFRNEMHVLAAKRTQTDFLVSPNKLERFKQRLQAQSIPFHVANNDIGMGINDQRISLTSSPFDARKAESLSKFADTYRSYAEWESFMRGLKEQNPTRCQMEEIGKSYEGRSLWVLQINEQDSPKDKYIAFIQCGAHSREWLAATGVAYMMNWLANDDSPEAQEMRDTFDWRFHFHNPDGYEYSRNVDRMWRKNTSGMRRSGKTYLGTKAERDCQGTDLNRNYDIVFGQLGASNDKCDETYHGLTANSEPETLAEVNYIEKINRDGRVLICIAWHSYSQMVLYSYGYKAGSPPNHKDLEDVSKAFCDAVFVHSGTKYTMGPAADTLYSVSGGSDDWANEKQKIPYSFTIEVRDTGKHGFIYPAKKVPESNVETWTGWLAMFQVLAKKHSILKSASKRSRHQTRTHQLKASEEEEEEEVQLENQSEGSQEEDSQDRSFEVLALRQESHSVPSVRMNSAKEVETPTHQKSGMTPAEALWHSVARSFAQYADSFKSQPIQKGAQTAIN